MCVMCIQAAGYLVYFVAVYRGPPAFRYPLPAAGVHLQVKNGGRCCAHLALFLSQAGQMATLAVWRDSTQMWFDAASMSCSSCTHAYVFLYGDFGAGGVVVEAGSICKHHQTQNIQNVGARLKSYLFLKQAAP
jgi:hypothetical protein